MKLFASSVVFLSVAPAIAAQSRLPEPMKERLPVPVVKPWTDESELIADGWVRTKSATHTQAIATTNNLPSINWLPRAVADNKYLQPGGLEFATGWTSRIYYKQGTQYFHRQRRVPVLNSFFNYQYELAWVADFVDGSKYLDVLEHKGEVFAVRMAVKENGRWDRFTDYRNRKAEPPGYVHQRRADCAQCHSEVQSGNYGAALAAGSDGIFSVELHP